MKNTNLLIIGAGPYGLAMAAYAKHLGIDHLVIGKPMELWKKNMPKGMHLRSGVDWPLDPTGIHTIENFLATQDLVPKDVEPLSLEFYLSYAQWFQAQKQIDVMPFYVKRLDIMDDKKYRFKATLENGDVIQAQQVVIAVGFKYFKYWPLELSACLPEGRFSHTCDYVDFQNLKNKNCLIIGGRQSAFEWAALIHEAGARSVHLSYRHETPQFKPSDWSWVNPLADAMADHPSWYRNLSQKEKEDLSHRFWSEGRLKLEPWLAARITKPSIKLWPKTKILVSKENPNGELQIELDNGEKLMVDHVVLATGYKVNIDQIPFLAEGNILEQLKTHNGYPVLDVNFQTNISKLFITSLAAGQDFGPFFGFTLAVRTTAKLIGAVLSNN
jgi:FAD-dependent urate hydroxylase